MSQRLQDLIDADEVTVEKMATENGVEINDSIGSMNAVYLREFLSHLAGSDGEVKAKFQTFLETLPVRQAELQAQNMQYDEQTTVEDTSNDDMTGLDGELMKSAGFVPMRLTFDERRLLRLIESALHVSEYTDRVDIAMYASNKARRITTQIKQMCAILSGLFVAHNYEQGSALIKERDFSENAEFFKMVFEIGRRYKILNPERMRDSYGKLVYLLMDSAKPDVQDLLEFECVNKVRTVHDVLSQHKKALNMLNDPLLKIATSEVLPDGKSRGQIQAEIKQKNKAVKTLAQKYATVKRQKNHGFFRGVGYSFGLLRNAYAEDSSDEETQDGLTEDDVEQCIYSLGDHSTYLRFNRDPVVKMLGYLRKYFDPNQVETSPVGANISLAINSGVAGARLTHSHQRQYAFVLQTLILWKHVLGDMFRLWHLAEADLLSEKNRYRLIDTGQGLQRVQAAPRVMEAMCQILNLAQKEAGGWLGSSMIHLGDHNVPNALMFIDKYIQVPRILGPLVTCLDKLEDVASMSPDLRTYLDTFGGVDQVRKLILSDFFRHGFDGSGADNFYDAGSCVDGRLTSAWNWCSKIEKKPYWPVMLLTGFTGFDGKDGW